MKRPARAQLVPPRQNGVAAVEFALVLTALVLMLYGIATFAAVFHTQQTLARAAENGARAAMAQVQMAQATGVALEAAKDHVRTAVHASLADSLIVPLAHGATPASRREWVTQNVVVTVSDPSPSVTVTVTYPYAESGLFPSVPLLDAARWVPDPLSSHATAAMPAA